MADLSTKRKNMFQRRHAYLDDFRKTVSGEYVYAGKLYSYAGEKTKNSALLRILPFAIIPFLIILACGFFHVSGMSSCAYVLLPYTVAVIISAVALWAFVHLMITKEPIRHYIFKETVPRFRRCALLTLIFSAATLIGDIVYVSINGFLTYRTGTIVFMILHVIAIACAVFSFTSFRKIKWNFYDPETDTVSPAYEKV